MFHADDRSGRCTTKGWNIPRIDYLYSGASEAKALNLQSIDKICQRVPIFALFIIKSRSA